MWSKHDESLRTAYLAIGDDVAFEDVELMVRAHVLLSTLTSVYAQSLRAGETLILMRDSAWAERVVYNGQEALPPPVKQLIVI